MGLFGIGNKKKIESARRDAYLREQERKWEAKQDKRFEREQHTHNKAYAELVEFDKGKLGYPIHKRLRLYV